MVLITLTRTKKHTDDLLLPLTTLTTPVFSRAFKSNTALLSTCPSRMHFSLALQSSSFYVGRISLKNCVLTLHSGMFFGLPP